jgi:thiol-disulfide isomerase/thioredoxin
MMFRFTFVVVALIACLTHAERPTAAAIKVGEKVPDFSLTTLDGRVWKFSELRAHKAFGKDGIAVLTFWCSFCHSCRHVEHPLDNLAKKYKGRVLVMAIDSSVGETVEEVAAFKKKERLSLPIGLDPEGHAADIFGAKFTTTTAVIDGEGVLRYFGQFGRADHRLAENGLKDVLANRDVEIDHSRQRG